MGGQMASLVDKEKASVLSTVNRALACFTSDPMTRFLAKTTWNPDALSQARDGDLLRASCSVPGQSQRFAQNRGVFPAAARHEEGR